MFTMRSIGCAVYILAFAASACQAAYTPSTPVYPNASSGNVAAREHKSQSSGPLNELFGYNAPARNALAGLTPRDNTASSHDTGTVKARDVYSPRILNPHSSTKWVSGQTALIQWDTSDPPKSITNRNGKVVLGYMDQHGDEHLFVDQVLASNFDIMTGHVKVKVPQVPPGNNYIVILFGDSGNRSPEFSIN